VEDLELQQNLDAPDIAVIVPVFNEKDAIGTVLTQLTDAAGTMGFEIVVVDDGSTDGSSEVIAGFSDRLQIERHPSNHGYGASLKTGIMATRAKNVVFFDGDGQHNVNDLKAIFDALNDHECAFGQRQRGGGAPMIRQPGKWVLSKVCNFLAMRKIPDINCGLRGGRRRIYMQMLDLLPDGFSFSTTSLLFTLRSRFSVVFIPVTVAPRKGKSTVRIFYDGTRTVLLALRLMMLFDPMRAFGYPAVWLIIIGVLYQFYIFWTTGLHIEGGAIISILAGIILFHFGLLGDQIASLRKEMSSQTSLFWEEHRMLEDIEKKS
jgi:glycosyltransferase involved in cell wall biosynthesis